MSPAITVEGVSKRFRLYHERNQSLKASLLRRGRARYEDLWALRDVSLEVPAGQTIGLIGENGSGKSTLLKCLARILRPDEGRVELTGRMSALLELGAGFHPELSGRENVYLNGSILGLGTRQIDARFERIVEFSGLERFIDAPVKSYSSGMYVRLGFSVATQVDPEVLLVDEVLAVGDEQFQRMCHERFAELKAAGTTIVLVSHDLGSVRAMCDHAAWLDQGRLERLGAAGMVVDDYLDHVNVERDADGGQGSRWGSGEGRIEQIQLLDAGGMPTTACRTGDAVTIRLRYAVDEPIERPVFGVSIHTVDGTHVTAPNTREAGCVPERIHTTGVVDLAVDPLLLLPGTYDVSAALADHAALHMFDFRQRAFRFDVRAGTPHETYGGIVSLAGRWRVGAPEAQAGSP